MEISILARNDSWKRRKTKITLNFFMNIDLIYIWSCQDWWDVSKLAKAGVTGLSPKLITSFLKEFECLFAFNYLGSQVFPMIIEFLQWIVVFTSFFLNISDFFIQQSVFKIFDDTLVLDAAENVCKLQNSIEESRTTNGKKWDFLTMEQTKCKNLSEDQLKKPMANGVKNSQFQLWTTLEKLSRHNKVVYDNLMRKSRSLLGKMSALTGRKTWRPLYWHEMTAGKGEKQKSRWIFSWTLT